MDFEGTTAGDTAERWACAALAACELPCHAGPPEERLLPKEDGETEWPVRLAHSRLLRWLVEVIERVARADASSNCQGTPYDSSSALRAACCSRQSGLLESEFR